MNYPELKYQLLSEFAKDPIRGTTCSSGFDVFTPKDVEILPKSDILIPIDIRFDIPYGWDLVVYNKSGISIKKKLVIGACVIDCDYRGNVFIHMFNLGDEVIKFNKGEKITQLIMREVWMGDLIKVDNIDKNTERGEGSQGSTGN